MAALSACTPHYIRCIKPNHEKVPNKITSDYVLHQVEYLGLLENVTVRRAGYANRMPYARFVSRYGILCKSLTMGDLAGAMPEDQTRAILDTLHWTQNTEYAMGRTKLFIRTSTSVSLCLLASFLCLCDCLFHLFLCVRSSS